MFFVALTIFQRFPAFPTPNHRAVTPRQHCRPAESRHGGCYVRGGPNTNVDPPGHSKWRIRRIIWEIFLIKVKKTKETELLASRTCHLSKKQTLDSLIRFFKQLQVNCSPSAEVDQTPSPSLKRTWFSCTFWQASSAAKIEGWCSGVASKSVVEKRERSEEDKLAQSLTTSSEFLFYTASFQWHATS